MTYPIYRKRNTNNYDYFVKIVSDEKSISVCIKETVTHEIELNELDDSETVMRYFPIQSDYEEFITAFNKATNAINNHL